jgi:hypothetical protein
LGRVINPNGVGKERNRLMKITAVALRELMSHPEPDNHSRDLAAFIAAGLEAIAGTIDQSVTAWEKRGYWVKADKFRMEWRWADRLSTKLRTALLADDWGEIAGAGVELAGKLSKVKLPKTNRYGTPWKGAWEQLKRQS